MSLSVKEMLERSGPLDEHLTLILDAVAELLIEFDQLANNIGPEEDALRRFLYEVSLFRSFVDLTVGRTDVAPEAQFRQRLLRQTKEDFDQMKAEL